MRFRETWWVWKLTRSWIPRVRASSTSRLFCDVRPLLGPHLADVSPGRHLVPQGGQRLHHLPPALGGRVAAHREDQELARADAQGVAHRAYLRILRSCAG